MSKGVRCILAAAVVGLMAAASAEAQATGTLRQWNAQPVFGFDPTDVDVDPPGVSRLLDIPGSTLTVCAAYENYNRGAPCGVLCWNPATNRFCGMGWHGGIDRDVFIVPEDTLALTHSSGRVFGPGDIWNVVGGSDSIVWFAGTGRDHCQTGTGTESSPTAELKRYSSIGAFAIIVDSKYRVFYSQAYTNPPEIRQLDVLTDAVIRFSFPGVSGEAHNLTFDSAERILFTVLGGSDDYICRLDPDTAIGECWNLGPGRFGYSGFIEDGIDLSRDDIIAFAETASGKVSLLDPFTDELCSYQFSTQADIRQVSVSGSRASGNLQVFASEGSRSKITLVTESAPGDTCRTCETRTKSTIALSVVATSVSSSEERQPITADTISPSTVTESPEVCGTSALDCDLDGAADDVYRIMRYPTEALGTTPAGISGVTVAPDGSKAIYFSWEGNDTLGEFTSCAIVAPPDVRRCGANVCTDAGVCTATLTCDEVAECSEGLPVCSFGASSTFPLGTTPFDATCGTETETCQVIVRDCVAPICEAPAALTIECSEIGGSPSDDPTVIAWLESVMASDNCTGIDSIDNDIIAFLRAGCLPDGKSRTVTWTVRDGAGNSGTCSSTVTVVDTLPPEFDSLPTDAAISCADPVPAVPILTATDVCHETTTVTYLGEERRDGSCPDNYTLIRSWEAVEEGLPTESGTLDVCIYDPISYGTPGGDCSAFTTSLCSDGYECFTDTTKTSSPFASPDATAIESIEFRMYFTCEPATFSFFVNGTDVGTTGSVSPGPSCPCCCDPPPSSYPYVFTVTDEATLTAAWDFAGDNTLGVGNSDSTYYGTTCVAGYSALVTYRREGISCGQTALASQTITVDDTEPPTITGVPADETIECDEPIPPPGTATADDNCDPDPTFVTSETTTPGDCDGEYTVLRTYTAMDRCFNESDAAQTITAEDTTPPTLTGVPADATVECDSIPGPATPTASDNCSTATITFSEATTPGSCTDSFTIVRTWTATDDCGNDTVDSQTITVRDTTAPVFSSAPADVTAECDAVPGVPTVTATDNCDTDVTFTFVEARADGSCPDSYTLTRTWTATDNCGNSSTHVQRVTVVDTTAPVFSSTPADVTVECDAVPSAATVTASDNCDTDVTFTFAEARADGSCPDSYTLTRTWTATDNCGNSSTHVQRVTVVDTTAPVFTATPADETVECDAVPTPATVAASDNCDTDVTFTFVEVRADGSCPDSYTLTRTWTATDNCGNSSTHVQRVTVVDTTPPVFTATPADETAECDAVPATPTVAATDNCDTSVTVTFAEVRSAGSCEDSYTLTRTWTATDNCGNSSTHVQVVTVADTTAPLVTAILMPADPLPPRSSSEPHSVCSAPSARVFVAVCGASDNCDPTPATTAVLELTTMEVIAEGVCVPRVEELEVACGELVEIRLVAPPCARQPRSAGASVSVNSDGIKVITAERVVLAVTAVDRCGNDATAEYDPAAEPSPLCDEVLDDGTCCPAISPEDAKDDCKPRLCELPVRSSSPPPGLRSGVRSRLRAQR